MNRCTLRAASPHFDPLMEHLFPGDGDEHGAVLSVGTASTGGDTRLLVRQVFLARDGIDYVPGRHGYRALTADFVARVSDHCARERLGYLAVHCHGGTDTVGFSPTDLESHRRGYPALLDITNGGPVGALVFARDAVAGQVWTRSGVFPLDGLTVIGPRHRRLRSSPVAIGSVDAVFHRQSLLFGAAGQELLRRAKIGIIGLGGAGSLVSEWLAHLGVGHIVGIDFDRVEPTNRPRIVGSTRWDAQGFLRGSRLQWLQQLGLHLSAYKVEVAARVARRANPDIRYTALAADVADARAAESLKDADFVFLCADSAQSRLVFNAVVHQYLVPGMQIGSKVPVARSTGAVGDVFTASRPVQPNAGGGCLLCNGLIPADQLQREALSPDERRRQRYVDDPDVHAPSVITLNALASAQAVNDFLFGFLGLRLDNSSDAYLMHFPRERRWLPTQVRTEPSCLHCGRSGPSVLARGDAVPLPCRQPS